MRRRQRAGSAMALATWLVLGASLGAGLLFLAVRAALPSDGARISFYADAWSAEGVRIAPIDQPAAGLRSGDLVRAVDGRSLEAWLGDVTIPSIARPGAGERVRYAVDRDGATVEADVALGTGAVAATLLDGWSILLFSIATAGLAAFVFARRPDEPSALALVLGAAGAAGSSLPWFLGITVSDIVQGAPFVLHALVTGPVYMLMWPAAVHLALVFPRPIELVRRRRATIPLVYAAALGAYGIGMLVSRIASPGLLEWVGSWPLVQLLVVVPSLTIAIVVFGIRYAREADPVLRARVQLATLGVVSGGGLGLLSFMGPELVLGHALLPDSAIGLTALPVPLGFAAAILRDRLFDIDAAINRGLVYGGLTLGVLLTYLAVATGLRSVLGPADAYGASLLATGAAALAALPLRDALQRAVNRLMYGHRDEPWRAMRRLGTRLEWAADPERAVPAIAETVAEALRLPYVAVRVLDDAGAVALAVERGATAGPTTSIPLVHAGAEVGSLVLGVRRGERGFRRDELAVLEDLGRQAGTAIRAQRLRDDLARSRARLVAAREEERRRLRRDLHDGLGPSLAAIGMRAEAASALLHADLGAAERQLDALAEEVRSTLADVRRLVEGLRPPALDELGLMGAIGQQAARLDASGAPDGRSTAIRVEADPEPLPPLPAAIEVAAYRIAVEAMTNAVRHAGASECEVRLAAGRDLTLEVVDDGRGLPERPRRGTGLESMRERAVEVGGVVEVQRRPEGGTRVLVRLPLGGTAPA